MGSFRTRIREVERTLWKDFQNLERALELRTKRIDHLEKTMLALRHSEEAQRVSLDGGTFGASRSASRASSRSAKDDHIVKLKNENKLLKAEVQVLRTTTSSSSGSRSGVPERASSQKTREVSLMRHYSSSAVEGLHDSPPPPLTHVAIDPTVTVPGQSHIPIPTASPLRRVSQQITSRDSQGNMTTNAILQPKEQRWVLRLKELEKKLKAEREARSLDRSGARKRIEQSEAEKEELRLRLEREIEIRQSLEAIEGRASIGSLVADSLDSGPEGTRDIDEDKARLMDDTSAR
jgi:hypothetical protein